MIVLGIDSALDTCSAALWQDGRMLARTVVPGARDQAERLVPIVQETMRGARLAWSDLDRIAVTVGPGSFTGLRVGLAAARGFALAAKRPAIGVTTLAALAHSAKVEGALGVAIEAGRGEVYFQMFVGGAPVGQPESLVLADAIAKLPRGAAVVGGGAQAMAPLLEERPDLRVLDLPQYPDPAVLAALGAAAPLPADGAPPSPLYIQPPRIKLPGGVSAPT